MMKRIPWALCIDFHETDGDFNVTEWQWLVSTNDEDDPRNGIYLRHEVQLNYSTTLYKWLARNCHGHYSTSSRIAWAKRHDRPMNFMFENDRDAVLAKLFHGGA